MYENVKVGSSMDVGARRTEMTRFDMVDAISLVAVLFALIVAIYVEHKANHKR